MSATFAIDSGDWVIDEQNGRPKMVSDRAKLSQDVKECLSITPQPSGFGAGLDDLVGEVIDSFGVQILATQRIQSGIMTMQRLQLQHQANQRSPYERISGISTLRVMPLEGGAGKTGYAFTLGVSTVASLTVTTKGVIS